VKRKEAGAHSLNPVIPPYYPVYLDLTGRKAVVIGGGTVAERKIRSLLKARADVKVISPHLTKSLERQKGKGTFIHVCRSYRRGDLSSAFLVIAATDSQRINERVSRDAPCLVNVVDKPDLCNFIVPSLVQRGHLRFAISTSGMSPALSRSIRKELEKIYGQEFADYVKVLKIIRKKALHQIRDKKKRTAFLKSVASEQIINMLRGKGLKKTKRFVTELSQKAVKKESRR
jgi:precorrin-2 dehydrogenase/sirohydrochlorin ferrochelatase